MSYSRKVYARAASELERRRDKAERTQSMRRAEVYAKIPELISIDREIASAGAEVIRAIGMGENAQQFIEELAKKISPLSSAARIYSKKTAIPRTILTRNTPAKSAAIRALSAELCATATRRFCVTPHSPSSTSFRRAHARPSRALI